jgi:hypothetical protein
MAEVSMKTKIADFINRNQYLYIAISGVAGILIGMLTVSGQAHLNGNFNSLSIYDGAKGSVKFPIEKPLPFELISRIVRFRVEENLRNFKNKQKLP